MNNNNIEALKRRRTRDKSGKAFRWSEKMSPEAQIAMQLAIEDTKALKLEEEEAARSKNQPGTINGQSRSPTRVAFADEQTADPDSKDGSGSAPSFSELYQRNGSARMHRDLTDDHYSEDSESKKALGGGKVESAMEIIEIVNHDEPETKGLDEHAIDELARINSVDKCTVWIEATQGHQDTPQADPEGEQEEQAKAPNTEDHQDTSKAIPETGQEVAPTTQDHQDTSQTIPKGEEVQAKQT